MLQRYRYLQLQVGLFSQKAMRLSGSRELEVVCMLSAKLSLHAYMTVENPKASVKPQLEKQRV